MNRPARWALVAYGVAWLAVAGFIAVVIRLQVPAPGELLRDVAGHRALWIGANALLIAQQALLTIAAPALAAAVRARSPVAGDAVGGLLAITAGALIASGICHGVLGAHVADEVSPGPLDPDLVRVATVLHALGDTAWFVGLGALAAATAVCSAVWWSVPGRRHVARLGAATVVCVVLQFGWFFDHVFGLFAGPGTLLQAAWCCAVGAAATESPPLTAATAPTLDHPPSGD